ncbi:MAG TPA: YdeI/OmpD-associated family protein [Gemmatimonadaceae bacterium]|nr:YdeI/OmpD-associated family protein [Gemmatimonadaceae bacterium]
MDPKPGDPLELFAEPADFERWMRRHHATASCVWVKYAKKKSGIPSIDWNQAVDVALCYGWIDGQSKSLDETYAIQRFTPRGRRSKWSKLNRERVARLVEAGRMQPAGLAEVERAKADGRWEAAYDSPSTAKVPDDLARELAKSAKAKKCFDSLSSANRYSILYRLQEAKKPETRARRLAKFVEMLQKGEKLNP